MKEITNLNRRNNNEILKQIAFIAKLFKKNKIEYVFLKGSAMLIFKPYKTVDDRMIGDIDILVSEKDLFKAKKVLIAANFQQLTSKFNFTKGVISQRHLKRLIHPNYISAVELHRRLLIDEKSDQINSRNILKNKIKTNKGYFIPSKNDLWLHAILNWQYNDNGYLFNTFSLRSFLDVVHLENKNISSNLVKHKVVRHFYSLCSIFIDTYPNANYFSTLTFKYKLQYHNFRLLSNFIVKFKFLSIKIFQRLLLITKSRNYRHRIFQNPKLLIKRLYDLWRDY